MAATVKPNAAVMTTNGMSGSADSSDPGRATRMLTTLYKTASGHIQLASVKAADGRSPLSTHHSPPMPAELLELLEVDEVGNHFLRREVVEQAQHTLEEQAILATAQLLGHDDPGMALPGGLP